MIKNLSRKFYRLKTSRNYLRFIKIFHHFFGEKFRKEIELPKLYNNLIHRKEIINEIIKLKNFNDYLEIGCDQNQLFSKIEIENKTGVDPESGGNIKTTSDDFFSTNTKKFDIIFIDGLHIYEQVKKDILNSINCLNDGGIVLVHDCMPDSLAKQAVPRFKMKWNGDVWKSIVELRTRNDLNIITCLTLNLKQV